jgi:hypothetical protein
MSDQTDPTPAPAPDASLVYCRCAYAQVVPQGVKDAVLTGLCDRQLSFDAVADLCQMAAHRDPRLAMLAQRASDGTPLRIAACFPRAVRGLFTQVGSPLPAGIEILNMREQTAAAIVASMAGEAAGETAAEGAAEDAEDAE